MLRFRGVLFVWAKVILLLGAMGRDCVAQEADFGMSLRGQRERQAVNNHIRHQCSSHKLPQ
jgi:hypothetical protein